MKPVDIILLLLFIQTIPAFMMMTERWKGLADKILEVEKTILEFAVVIGIIALIGMG